MRFGSPPTWITFASPDEGVTTSTWPSRKLLTYVLTGLPEAPDNTAAQKGYSPIAVDWPGVKNFTSLVTCRVLVSAIDNESFIRLATNNLLPSLLIARPAAAAVKGINIACPIGPFTAVFLKMPPS